MNDTVVIYDRIRENLNKYNMSKKFINVNGNTFLTFLEREAFKKSFRQERDSIDVIESSRTSYCWITRNWIANSPLK